MGCPYHYEPKKKSNLPLVAGLAIGAISVGYALLKNKSLSKGTDDMNISNQTIGHEFYMPHFMVKNVRLAASENVLTVNVDYRINQVLMDYLINNRPKYYFKLILPEKYEGLFQESAKVIEGEAIAAGSNRSDYTVTFQFEAKPETTVDEIEAIDVADKIQMTILDDKDTILNDFPDVYNAANIIRY